MKTAEKRLHEITQYCDTHHIKLTPLRLATLQVLHEQENPISAYELLRILKATHPKAQAMTVYRILSFLEDQHLIHRITSCNAYTACGMPTHRHHAQLLLCDQCGHAEEIAIASLAETIHTVLQQHHFALSTKPTEIFGVCENCQIAASSAAHAETQE